MLSKNILAYIEKSGILLKEKPLIVILGQTGTGKTDVSIQIAKELNGEIISADSAQIYRNMDIGTAKITEDEMQGIPHHMIDIIDPDEDFSAAVFKQMAEDVIREIYAREHIPLVVGGTMLWIDSLVYNYQFPDMAEVSFPADSSEKTLQIMRAELQKIDPVSYAAIDNNNARRVARALAYAKSTGKSLTEEQRRNPSSYSTLLIGLKWPRDLLYAHLDARVDEQLNQGLVEEVKKCADKYGNDTKSMQSISYRQIGWYLQGEMTLPEAVEKLKQANRNYAKRQMTWWRKNTDIKWFDCK